MDPGLGLGPISQKLPGLGSTVVAHADGYAVRLL